MDISYFKPIVTFLVLTIFSVQLIGTSGSIFNHSRNSTASPIRRLEPFMPREYQILEGNLERRRKLAPFQLCLLCKCCAPGGDPNTCTSMPCCFGIDCQLPNKPFGVCAFVPKTCNCTTCAT